MSTSPISIPRTSPSASAPLNSVTGHVVLGTAGKAVQPMALVNSTPVQAPSKSNSSVLYSYTSSLFESTWSVFSANTVTCHLATGIARAVSPAAGGIRTVQYPTIGGMTTSASNTLSNTASRNLPPTPASSVNSTNEPTDQIPVRFVF